MPTISSEDGLSPKQARLVEEYLIDLNATQAAIRAGYSPKTAFVQGWRTLQLPHVQAAVTAAMAARSARTRITQDRVLEELAVVAFSDIDHYTIDAGGDVALTPTAPRNAKRAIASVKKKIIPTKDGTVYETEIHFWNKPASLKMTGDHLGMFDQKVVHAFEGPLKIEAVQYGDNHDSA